MDFTKDEIDDNWSNDTLDISLDDSLINQITYDLDNLGFHCIENSVPGELINSLSIEVKSCLDKYGHRYFSMINPVLSDNSALCRLRKNGKFNALLAAVLKKGGSTELSPPILNVLRIVSGDNLGNQSLKFHFDASVLTVLIPVIIPENLDSFKSGDLLLIPNLRKVRSSALINVIEKMLIQNPVTRKIISYFLLKKLDSYTLKLKPGNIYFFWGYRSLHANLSIDPEYTRATLLFHIGNPHHNSSIVRLIFAVRSFLEEKNLKRKD